MAIRDISVPMRVALPCYVIGKIIFFVSFSVNYWLEDSDDHFNAGLWKLCFSGGGAKACYLWTDTDTVKDWQRGTSVEWRGVVMGSGYHIVLMLVCVGGGGVGGGEREREKERERERERERGRQTDRQTDRDRDRD